MVANAIEDDTKKFGLAFANKKPLFKQHGTEEDLGCDVDN